MIAHGRSALRVHPREPPQRDSVHRRYALSGPAGLAAQTGTRGFTKKYGVHLLVYVELHETMPAALEREKQIKEWKRWWKLELIESVNPEWRDLYEDMLR